VRIHDLRHNFASHLASNGVSLQIVGKLLGHTQASTTMRYAHLQDEALRSATNKFGTIFTKAAVKKTAVKKEA
jgi:site-specific recombinase XerD